ncbi:MAG: hypothetical protein GY822_02955 [Deltaproteobacteria bacterium]|nr:hypothetical protein [Deltaproteobacteria bacterium]
MTNHVFEPDVSGPDWSNETSLVSVPGVGLRPSQFQEPWMHRAREVDDDTLDFLMTHLVQLHQTKYANSTFGFFGGMFLLGVPNFSHGWVSLLVYGTLAAVVGMPAFAVGSLSVRRLFLREAKEHGLSSSAAMLLLTRAERKALSLRPFLPRDKAQRLLIEAVREPDKA